MSAPSWFQVARRPKWIAGLFLSLAIAAIFALLGQWQLSRSFETIEEPSATEQVRVLTDFEAPGQGMNPEVANRVVSAEIYLDLKNIYVVGNRIQQVGEDSISGYWLIANSSALLADGESTASLTVALGFTSDLATALSARSELMDSIQAEAFLPKAGIYIQTEAPKDIVQPFVLDSLSLAQLVNLYSAEPVASFAGILVLGDDPGLGLERISFATPTPGLAINWLTLFYAAEWALFAGFALFLWWRLVEDQRLREER